MEARGRGGVRGRYWKKLSKNKEEGEGSWRRGGNRLREGRGVVEGGKASSRRGRRWGKRRDGREVKGEDGGGGDWTREGFKVVGV